MLPKKLCTAKWALPGVVKMVKSKECKSKKKKKGPPS